MSNNEGPLLYYNSYAIPVIDDDLHTEAYSDDHAGPRYSKDHNNTYPTYSDDHAKPRYSKNHNNTYPTYSNNHAEPQYSKNHNNTYPTYSNNQAEPQYSKDHNNTYPDYSCGASPSTSVAWERTGSMRPTGSTDSKDSGYIVPHSRSANIRTSRSLQGHRDISPASYVRAVQGEEKKKTNESDPFFCRIPDYEYQTNRAYDLAHHRRTHFRSEPGEKLSCPAKGCGRTGEYGFEREHNLRDHSKRVHGRDIPKQSTSRREPGLHIRNPDDDSEAPSELKAQAETDNKMAPPPPMPPMEPVKDSSEPIGFPKSPTVKRPTFQSIAIKSPKTPRIDFPGHGERLRSLSSQSPYLADISQGTTSGIEKSISHDMGEDDKASPSSTSLGSVGDLQVAPEPRITHSESISQSVKFGYGHNGLNPNEIERRPSTVSADVERSKLTIIGERGVQDTVEPEKIISGPDNEARASILDHSVHTMPLTLIDTDDGLLSSLTDDGDEHLQDGYDVSFVDEGSCSDLNPVEHLANATVVEDGAGTGFSGEPIEPAEDISRHQKPVELSEAVMDSDEPSIANNLMVPEKGISGHVHPVKPPENITIVEDAARMNPLGNLVEVVDDRSSHMAHNTHASNKLVHMAPQYDAYVMTLLSLRIELRIWNGHHAPSPTIHISTRGEELLEDGKQRIRWTCCCGRRLYDDFEELRPGAIEELEQMLNEQNRVCSPESNGSAQQSSSSIRALWTAAGGIIASLTGSRPSRNNNLPTLPLHQRRAGGQERNTSSSSVISETLYLLMCVPYRKHGTRLVHMDLAELVSDETLFRKLRHEYQSIRGQWASYFSLWKIAEIQFVKFGLHKHQLVDIKEKNGLPPESLKDEYRYQPIPAETIPPIGKNRLMHLYEHPNHTDDEPFCLERIPKKVREQLKLSPHQKPGLLGWGVYLAEGFDWPKFWVFGSVVLSLSVIFGVCWSTFRQDIQGGFGVTACMMVAVTFTTGIVQAAVEQR